MIKRGDTFTVQLRSRGSEILSLPTNESIHMAASNGKVFATKRKERRIVTAVYLDGRVRDQAGDVWTLKRGGPDGYYAVR